MIHTHDELLKDIEAVKAIPIVPNMLEVICELTGMGFAAVARVTSNRWIACCVRDKVNFGLEEGGELQIETTLCNEIRDSRTPVVIDHVANDPVYNNHHTQKIYNLQSYISYPIILKNGTFFGTLCAIDSKPAPLKNNKIMSTFSMFAELLSFHLQSQDVLDRSYKANLELDNKNKVLTDVNFELDNFVYTASHDLKLPLINIEGLVDILTKSINKDVLERKEIDRVLEMIKNSIHRFKKTIKELTLVVETDKNHNDESCASIDFQEVVEIVKEDLQSLIKEYGAKIIVLNEENLQIKFSQKNFKSLLYNLISNGIKYSSPERQPEIQIKLIKKDGNLVLTVQDNGLGIPEDKQDKIFTMSKRLHNHVEGSGIGLFIVKRIVDKMKGKILVDSTVGKGTTFTIIF